MTLSQGFPKTIGKTIPKTVGAGLTLRKRDVREPSGPTFVGQLLAGQIGREKDHLCQGNRPRELEEGGPETCMAALSRQPWGGFKGAQDPVWLASSGRTFPAVGPARAVLLEGEESGQFF